MPQGLCFLSSPTKNTHLILWINDSNISTSYCLKFSDKVLELSVQERTMIEKSGEYFVWICIKSSKYMAILSGLIGCNYNLSLPWATLFISFSLSISHDRVGGTMTVQLNDASFVCSKFQLIDYRYSLFALEVFKIKVSISDWSFLKEWSHCLVRPSSTYWPEKRPCVSWIPWIAISAALSRPNSHYRLPPPYLPYLWKENTYLTIRYRIFLLFICWLLLFIHQQLEADK